jgi:hypothetical protein
MQARLEAAQQEADLRMASELAVVKRDAMQQSTSLQVC